MLNCCIVFIRAKYSTQMQCCNPVSLREGLGPICPTTIFLRRHGDVLPKHKMLLLIQWCVEFAFAGTEMYLPTKERNTKKYFSPFGWLTLRWMWSSWRTAAAPGPQVRVMRSALLPHQSIGISTGSCKLRTSPHSLFPLMGMHGKLQCKVKKPHRLRWNGKKINPC